MKLKNTDMPFIDLVRTGLVKFLIVAPLLLLGACNVHQSLDVCPPPGGDDVRRLLYLRVEGDGELRTDITGSEELDDIMVYLFDRDEKLLDTIAYTQAMIRQGVPIDLTDADIEGGYVTVWANLGNSVEVSPVSYGADIDDLEVSMLAHDSRADFFLCPGDMFFGYEQIDFVPLDKVTEVDTVWLARKNSRLNITVRGLPAGSNAGDYYFNVESLYSAYNFEGTPQLEPRNIWEEGGFNASGDFVSPEPYIMIHNAPDHVYSENSRVVVDLYRFAGTRADTLIASADRDVTGNYILLEKGKTTNVLIVLDEATGDVELHIVLTPWDEIHQWTIW